MSKIVNTIIYLFVEKTGYIMNFVASFLIISIFRHWKYGSVNQLKWFLP